MIESLAAEDVARELRSWAARLAWRWSSHGSSLCASNDALTGDATLVSPDPEVGVVGGLARLSGDCWFWTVGRPQVPGRSGEATSRGEAALDLLSMSLLAWLERRAWTVSLPGLGEVVVRGATGEVVAELRRSGDGGWTVVATARPGCSSWTAHSAALADVASSSMRRALDLGLLPGEAGEDAAGDDDAVLDRDLLERARRSLRAFR